MIVDQIATSATIVDEDIVDRFAQVDGMLFSHLLFDSIWHIYLLHSLVLFIISCFIVVLNGFVNEMVNRINLVRATNIVDNGEYVMRGVCSN